MNPIIEKLKTKRWGSITTIDRAYVVGQNGINPNDGFFAIYMIDSEIIGISIGDDGSWKEVFSFNKFWLKHIMYVVKYFAKLYHIDTEFKER
jgi:hypothetical protein